VNAKTAKTPKTRQAGPSRNVKNEVIIQADSEACIGRNSKENMVSPMRGTKGTDGKASLLMDQKNSSDAKGPKHKQFKRKKGGPEKPKKLSGATNQAKPPARQGGHGRGVTKKKSRKVKPPGGDKKNQGGGMVKENGSTR